MQVQPYLFFEGRCQEALDFYAEAFGAETVAVMRYKDAPEGMPDGMLPPNSGEKIMHCSFRIGESVLMASDGLCSGQPKFGGVSLSIEVPTIDEAERLYAAVVQDGQIQMPMEATFFSPRFGMAADRFGVSWMILASASQG
jgi:PhnB protein